mmetsp:Transcript_10879/g.24720  ORF Transcript_10879/g.24720 Transcript_10879/m.24720 type:complete len:295 (+) Transcript_10879:3766-4650(+)
MSSSARCRRATVSSDCDCSSSRLFMVAVSLSCSACTRACCSASSACLALKMRVISARFFSAALRRWRLGSTVLLTREYLSIARTQRHRDLAALDTFSTVSGWKSGFLMYLASARMVLSGMLSLSYSSSDCRKLLWVSSFLASSQSGLTPLRRQTASMTVSTSLGGLANDLISVMSFLLRDRSADMAAWKAGIASSRSFCAEFLISCASSAAWFTCAASASTRRAASCAAAESRVTSSSRTLVSSLAVTSTGASFWRSILSDPTISLVSTSFCTPPWYLSTLDSFTPRCCESMDR